MMNHQSHITVRNEYGAECQRVALGHYNHHIRVTRTPYSPLHLSDYSFNNDLMYLGTHAEQLNLFVFPQKKNESYGLLYPIPTNFGMMFVSNHLFRNGTRVWHVGGATFNGRFLEGIGQTIISNLEYKIYAWYFLIRM